MNIDSWESLWCLGKFLGEAGNLAAEEVWLRKALWLGQKNEGPMSIALGGLFMDLGDCLLKQRKPEAELFYQQATKIMVATALRQGVIERQPGRRRRCRAGGR